jgi:hypothetical protein
MTMTAEDKTVTMRAEEREAWLAIRKEEGLKIDPETAEVDRQCGYPEDPYDLEAGCEYPEDWDYIHFARSSGSDIWVWFGDLPKATRDALWKRLDGQDPLHVLDHFRERAVPGCFCFQTRDAEAVIPSGLRSFGEIPDLILIRDGQTYGLELNAFGRPGDAQKAAYEGMRVAGAIVATAFRLDAAISQLEKWGLLRGRT